MVGSLFTLAVVTLLKWFDKWLCLFTCHKGDYYDIDEVYKLFRIF